MDGIVQEVAKLQLLNKKSRNTSSAAGVYATFKMQREHVCHLSIPAYTDESMKAFGAFEGLSNALESIIREGKDEIHYYEPILNAINAVVQVEPNAPEQLVAIDTHTATISSETERKVDITVRLVQPEPQKTLAETAA